MTPTPPPQGDNSTMSTRLVRRMAAVNGAALVVGYLPMARWERRIRATGGPGILGLQLARDASTAKKVLTIWGPHGRRAATEQTWADFVWMHTYGITGGYLVELARRRAAPGSWWSGSGRVVRWLPYTAVGCDVVEGVGQLRTLGSWTAPDERTVAMTRVAAAAKYTLLGSAGVWAVAAATIGARRPG